VAARGVRGTRRRRIEERAFTASVRGKAPSVKVRALARAGNYGNAGRVHKFSAAGDRQRAAPQGGLHGLLARRVARIYYLENTYSKSWVQNE
jgi:hypothetical protein